MRVQTRGILTAVLLLVAPMSILSAEPVTVDKPVRVEVVIKPADPKGREQKVIGEITQYDDDAVTVSSKSGERVLKWTELTPASAFDARKAVIDQKDARAWLELGRFGWSMNAARRADGALTTAVKLDPSLKPEADAIRHAAPGGKYRPATAPSGDDGVGTTPSETAGAAGALPPSQDGARIPLDKLVKYQKSTPEQDAAAIENARSVAGRVGTKLKLNFAELQTDHFIVFTDWDKREYPFLKENLEAAYALVSRQFDIPVKENVFVGKLPVFMLAKHENFDAFAQQIDHFSPGDTVAGYYASLGETGIGHLAMWKPKVTGNDLHAAEIRWGYVLTHEFTHAFVARYRSNQRVPRWLNEGLAEVIANSKFPRTGYLDFARNMAMQSTDLTPLFDDNRMPAGDMYPVMMTMVQMLIQHDRQAFIQFFDDVKLGEDPESALRKRFKIDYAQLVKGWKTYMTTGKTK